MVVLLAGILIPKPEAAFAATGGHKVPAKPELNVVVIGDFYSYGYATSSDAALRKSLPPTLQAPPVGFASWDAYWLDVGVPEDELGLGADCIVDPAGRGPRIWFQVVPEKKTLKNRLHLDTTVSGGRANPIETRRRLVDAEAQRLEALGATLVRVLCEDGVDHYGVAMRDPEGNEFDIN